ncbi:MAG: acetyltransferase [Marinibacterium sp.]
MPAVSDAASGDVVLFGTGLVAEVITVYLQRFSALNIVAYTVDREFMTGETFMEKPAIAWEDLPDRYPPGSVRLLGPLTYQRLNTVRRDRYLAGKEAGYEFASFIHPNNDILTDDIGENCVILEQNVIQPFVRIGDNVIIWSKNHIGHHTTIGDHCFVSSMVGISGSCTIGQECYVAGQVGMAHGLTVGDRCALLNAAGIGRNLPDDTVIAGPHGEIKPFPSKRILHLL